MNNYRNKIEEELRIYRECVNVHDLPRSFRYLTRKYLRPLLQEKLGIPNFESLFTHYVGRIAHSSRKHKTQIVSLGSGNCDFEVNFLRKNSLDCHITCYELNPDMLRRGAELAEKSCVTDRISFIESDMNSLKLDKRYDIYLAKFSLHHFIELEHIFSEIHDNMRDSSVFVVHDMIGRNGHMFWDNTLDFCNRIWNFLPDELKYNHQLKQHTPTRVQWDCSREGCEGIRAQDILPLMDRTFQFRDFATFFSLSTRFIDRDFGHNYNINNPLHKALLDMIWHYDDHLCRNKLLRPTQMLATAVRKTKRDGTGIRYTYFENPRELYMMNDDVYNQHYDAHGEDAGFLQALRKRIKFF